MTDKPAHDAGSGPDRPGPAADGETPTASAAPPEPLAGAGIGGIPDPDAPSRRPRPEIVSLVGEFFKMSRTTAVLLVAFVLLSMVYAAVKDEPVLIVGPPPAPTQTVPAEQTPTRPSAEPTTGTSVPNRPSVSAPTDVTSDDPASGQTTTSGPGRPGSQTTSQQPQQTAPPQQTQQPQLQPQQVPEGAAAGQPGTDQTQG